MIYITQLIHIIPGKEKEFLEFESHAIPLMEKYTGTIIHRIRPSKESFIDAKTEELPYEIHFISFESEEKLKEFLNDDTRLEFLHLKEASIKTTLLVKGQKM